METHPAGILLQPASGFEPTYEGWKHSSWLKASVTLPVLSLPMRDGNPDGDDKRSRASRF